MCKTRMYLFNWYLFSEPEQWQKDRIFWAGAAPPELQGPVAHDLGALSVPSLTWGERKRLLFLSQQYLGYVSTTRS